jgi:two-component system response regulator AtoC
MSIETTTKEVRATANVLPPDDVLFGQSAAMADVRQKAKKICRTNVPVLVSGDGGTGKEAIARWIHQHSSTCNGEFVKVNCAAIPSTLLESELFGYEKGAFTGAQTAKPGRVEHANGGTLFLDEISDLDMGLQSKLLHFLQDGSFSRIGETTERRVDARMICATNKNLQTEIDAGRFRADLFYRINVVGLQLPKLRDRREDIPILAEYLLKMYEKQFAKESQTLNEEILAYLKNFEWPGNLRELSNGIARYVLIGPEGILPQPVEPKRALRPNRLTTIGSGVPLKRIAKAAIREMERDVILEALRANQWNRRKTAQSLKISYRALIYKIRDSGLAERKTRESISDVNSSAGTGSKKELLGE